MSEFVWRSDKYDIPPDDRLPEFAHEQAAKVRQARGRWIDAEQAAMEALHASERGQDTYRAMLADAAANGTPAAEVIDPRERLANESRTAADIAAEAKTQAQHEYLTFVDVLRSDPAATLAAVDAACEEAVGKIEAARRAEAEGVEELRHAMPQRRWVGGVLAPRGTGYTFTVWGGANRLAPASNPDDLTQLRKTEAERQRRHDALYNPPTPPATTHTPARVW